MRIAFATCAQFPALYEDDQPLVPALAARGIEAVPLVWNDPAAAWGDYPFVLCRSPWDYHHSAPAFLAWIDRVAAVSSLLNPPAMLRWNAHKGYLRDLEARGVTMVPTAWCPAGEPVALERLLSERGWRDAVVKPAVSAGATDTLRVRADDPARVQQAAALLASLVRRGEALVQPYLASVEGYGERSLVHFDGVFSHAIRKHPVLAPGGVDPQRQAPRVDASDAEIAFAARVLAAATASTGCSPAYARVDVARGADGALFLMELEVLEPCLFLRNGAAHERFVDVLLARIKELPARSS
jgi:hypothetical protein